MQCSVGNSMVAGSVSDLFDADERGVYMGLFALAVFLGQGVGPVLGAGLAAANAWRWIFWSQAIANGFCGVLMQLFVAETRGVVILRRRARKLTASAAAAAAAADADADASADTGACVTAAAAAVAKTLPSTAALPCKLRQSKCRQQERSGGQMPVVFCARGDDGGENGGTSVGMLVWASLSRPFVFLVREPVCLSTSMYLAFVWGTVFLSLSSVPATLAAAHGFSQIQSCLVLLAVGAAGAIGWAMGWHQDALYRRWHARHRATAAADGGGDDLLPLPPPPPEARLYHACFGAAVYPVGLLWFGWASAYGPAAVGIVGFTVANVGVFVIYVGVFSYLTDVYEHWASSALAANSWARNMGAAVVPLAGEAMYAHLRPQVATTIVAATAGTLGCVPFVLFLYGGRLRAQSPIARQIWDAKWSARTGARPPSPSSVVTPPPQPPLPPAPSAYLSKESFAPATATTITAYRADRLGSHAHVSACL